MKTKMMCNPEDVEFGLEILERKYESDFDGFDEKSEALYGDDFDSIEVPMELLKRLVTEVHHHKAMIANPDAGLLVTLSGGLTGEAIYAVMKDIAFNFRVKLAVPDAKELTDAEMEQVYDCAREAWCATLRGEIDAFKAEVANVLASEKTKSN